MPKMHFHHMREYLHHFVILTFFIVVFANTLHAVFALFLLVTIDVVYVRSMKFKHVDFLCHFFELNYRGLNLNFLKLKLLTDGGTESNPGPTQNDFKSPIGHLKKIKVFKGTAKKCDPSENSVNVASDPKAQNCFFNRIQPVSIDIIRPWSVTCPSTLESLKKM